MTNYEKAAKAAQKARATRKLTPTWIEWKKQGQYVVGKFLGRETVVGKTFVGEFEKYRMMTDDGPIEFKLGAASDRDTGCFLEEGSVYIITYKGEENTGKGNPRHVFEVEEIPSEVLAAEE